MNTPPHLPDSHANPDELEIVPFGTTSVSGSGVTEPPALTLLPPGEGMELLNTTYVLVGAKVGKRGRLIRIVSVRFLLECRACGKQIVRCGRSSLTARSCGCLGAWKKHGMSHKHPLYGVWHSMKDRCLNPNSSAAARYSQRGITLCPEWKEFLPFYNWAIDAGWKKGLFIDRTDNDGNYEPANCRFVSMLESNRNRSNVTIDETQALAIRRLLDVGDRLGNCRGVEGAHADDRKYATRMLLEGRGPQGCCLSRSEGRLSDDNALVGIASRCGSPDVLAYDVDQCIAVLMMEQGMDEVDALEHFAFNIEGAYQGERTPIFIRSLTACG